MMRLQVFSFLIFMSTVVNAQNIFSGMIYCSTDSVGLSGVQLYDYKNKKIISYTDINGLYSFTSKKGSLDIIFSLDGYRYFTKNISFKNESVLYMSELSFDLNEVVVEDQSTSFDIGKISDVIGTSIYAGKRTERILLSMRKV